MAPVKCSREAYPVMPMARPLTQKSTHFLHKKHMPPLVWLLASFVCLLVFLAVTFVVLWAGGIMDSTAVQDFRDVNSDLPQSESLKNYSKERFLRHQVVPVPKNTRREKLTLFDPQEHNNSLEKQSIEITNELNNSSHDVKEEANVILEKGNEFVKSSDDSGQKMETKKEQTTEKSASDILFDYKDKIWETRLKELYGRTQISSPDDAVGQVTTNQAEKSINDDAKPLELNKSKEISQQNKESSSHLGHADNSRQKPDSKMEFKPVPNLKFADDRNSDFVAEYVSKFKRKQTDDYGSYSLDSDYFLPEPDAQMYYNDYVENSWTGFIMEKVEELHSWLTSDYDTQQGVSHGNEKGATAQILQALNFSLVSGDGSLFLDKLRTIYYEDNSTDISFDPERSRRIITNTSNPISFGLLALDVLLLRNIQLMAWQDEQTANNALMSDPDVFALNALFMKPEQVKQIYLQLQGEAAERQDSLSQFSHRAEVMEGPSEVPLGQEIVDFAISSMRAAIHLGKAFRDAKIHAENQEKKALAATLNTSSALERGSQPLVREWPHPETSQRLQQLSGQPGEGMTELDCIWTLYCRNLDKMTKMDGPYGFLAKLNSVGLRLVLGVLPLEKALDTLLEETFTAPKGFNCAHIFPKCSEMDASKIVLENIMTSARWNL